MSRTNIQSLLAAGVGMIVGYFIFFVMYKSQCALLLNDRDIHHNKTLQTLQAACNEEQVGNSHRDLTQMQGLLDKQTTLASKYQTLLEKHEETLTTLTQTQKDKDASAQIIQSLNDDIQKLESDLDDSSKRIEKVQQHEKQQVESLTQQLELSKSMVRQKVEEVRSLQVDGSCTSTVRENEQIGRLQAAVRRRDLAQCRSMLGEGPYLAELTLETADSDETSLVHIHLNHVEEMPHTVWTFLTLIDLGLYVGTTLGVGTSSSPALTGGGLSSVGSSTVRSHLQRLYAEHGYGPEPFLLEEVAPAAPCSQFALGISNHGPQFFIPLQGGSPHEAYMSRSCPGEVVGGGREVLQQLQESGKRAVIRATRLVRRRANSNSEL